MRSRTPITDSLEAATHRLDALAREARLASLCRELEQRGEWVSQQLHHAERTIAFIQEQLEDSEATSGDSSGTAAGR